MSSDRAMKRSADAKLECFKIWSEVERYIHEDKRDCVRVAEILQWIINESRQEERITAHNFNLRAFIDGLILKTMSGEIKFVLQARVSSMIYQKGRESCEIMYELPSEASHDSVSNIRAKLRSDDFENVIELPLNGRDQGFFLSLLLEMRRERDRELLERFTQPHLS